MLDYKTLLHADFSELSQAVTQWGKLPEEFKKANTLYWNTVVKDIYGSDWKGEAATAAYEKLSMVDKQMMAAGDEAADVHKLLSDAHEIFTEAQRKLKTLTADIEKDKYLSIKPDGEVWFDPPEGTENQAQLNKAYQESIQAYRTSIGNQVTAAQEADDTLHWALSQDHNGRQRGFDSDTYNSIKDAQKGREQADKDLKELEKLTGDKSDLRLAGLSDNLDPKTLQRINALIAKHEGDPYFAEKFATNMGPKGTLELWTRIADRTQTGGDQSKASESIQKSLGYTLALASHSDSDAMDRWKKDMVGLGSKQVELLDMNAGTNHKGPYGFQVMSSLMRNGEYDKDFLKDYGKGLIDFEKDHSKTELKQLYRPDGSVDPFLSFGAGSDHGLDPMAGYMEALGHNPDAAKEMFYSKDWEADSKVDPELKYLMSDRKWPDGNPFAEDKRGYGYDELGHALEAATLGVPYDQPDLGLRRDDTTANIMSQVVQTVANDQGYVGDKPGIGNSLAKMGAGYIDDLDWAVGNFGDKDSGQALRDEAFNHKGPGHINLRHQTASDFLASVGKHEGSYEILSAAQHEYTSSALVAHRQPDAALSTILETGAKAHGILDQARVSEINHAYGEATDAANRKMAEAAEWKKFGVSQGVGLGVGLATLPFGGPATAAAVAFAVPAVIEGVGGAMETEQGIRIDRELAEKEADFDRKEEMDKTKFVDLGRRRAADPLDAYIAVHPGLDGTDWYKQTSHNIEAGYNAGDNETDQTDAD
ncbi:hypothetical protein OHA61_24135 [Streptomyces sp. NBC_00885]|uniref:hypothetical protein n=1 Tax=Streptomyces sp. NBC_00885 TaxID=2975857 RepID=UPI003866C168|nr:hypothetical protein OHA61_24135 [Streptomyces sp. NBC_00885]